MSAQSLLASQRKIVARQFSWLDRIGLAASGALGIRSAAGRIEIEGGGPAVARVGDLVVRLYWDSLASMLYVSTSSAAPYSWSPVASGIIPPTPADAGTKAAIVEGSARVTCG